MSSSDFTVLVTYAIPREGLTEVFDRCRVIYPEGKADFSREEIMEYLPECDAVLACGEMSREMIAAGKKLRIISNYGAGYDRVDVDAADEMGVYVTNIPDSTTESTAELAFALMIDARRRVSETDRLLRRGPSELAFGMGKYMGRNLAGATLGIVGMGRIGGRLAEMARFFGMRVIYHNRRPVEGFEEGWRNLRDLMGEADVISLNCPLTAETRGLIGREELACVRPDAVLINTSRGAVVDTDALIEALREGRLGGAGLDVFPNEPHVPEELTRMDNVVITPHIGTNTFEARVGMTRAAAQRILAVQAGRKPENVVNRRLALKSAK